MKIRVDKVKSISGLLDVDSPADNASVVSAPISATRHFVEPLQWLSNNGRPEIPQKNSLVSLSKYKDTSSALQNINRILRSGYHLCLVINDAFL